MNEVTNPKTVFKQQLSRIKYDILEPRENSDNDGDFNVEEYRKLKAFMVKTARELMKLQAHEPPRPISKLWAPVLRIKTITFIKENLPNYSKRLRVR